MQLPPYYGADRLEHLAQFIRRFPSSIRLAIELRHETWFNSKEAMDRLAEIMQEYNMAIVITDVAGRRDVLHQRLTTDIAMIRFVGNGLHPTDYQRIDDWIARMGTWFDQGLKSIYFFPHEPDNLLAPEIAVYLLEQVQKKLSVSVRGPKLIAKDGGQISLF